MKIIKLLLVILMSVISSIGTVFYLSAINLTYTQEFRPIPHMIPDEKLTLLLAGLLFFAFYFVLYLMLYLKKYLAFALSLFGIIYGLYQYKVVISNHVPQSIGFLPAFLSMGMTVCFLMAGGIVIQLVTDFVLRLVKVTTKYKK